MSRLEDISILLVAADQLLEKICAEYDQSLASKEISRALPVYIKNYLENLRSPLDYVAAEICERMLTVRRSQKAYFPISCENHQAFKRHVGNYLPGLDKASPALYQRLDQLQPYHPTGCEALPKLSKLVNENKHDHLSPQERTERRSLDIAFPGGARISIGPGASIAGDGIISSGDAWISPAGRTVSGDNPARIASANVQQTVTIWVSFIFSTTGDEVIGLLRGCRQDVETVLVQVRPLLWP